LNVPKLERELGIEVYASKSSGIGGRIRRFPQDFVVEEILLDGSKATVEPKDVPRLKGRGRYLMCVLVKRKWDTLLAVQAIAQQLGISQERIQIAGIKDANALTAQHITLSRTAPEQITSVKIRDLALYPLRFSNEKMNSRTLFGNQFCVVIREIAHPLDKIEEQIRNVQNELENLGGVPNFFGHQRFGTKRAITHVVGKHIVKGEWEKAVLSFLARPSEFEHPETRQARQQLWRTRDFVEAFRNFPFQLRHERVMLSHLSKHPRDFVGAFRRLPTKLCKLYVQAYQSYLFNKFLSQRIQHGLPLKKALKGEYKLKIEDEEYVALPLIGYKQSISMSEQSKIEKQVLEEERVTPQDFKVPLMPEISSSGGLRTALTPLIDLNIEKPSKDNANPEKHMLSLSFSLRKGSYATTILREFMKPRNPIKAGF